MAIGLPHYAVFGSGIMNGVNRRITQIFVAFIHL